MRKYTPMKLVAMAVIGFFVACSDNSDAGSANEVVDNGIQDSNGTGISADSIEYGTLTDSRDGKTYKTVTVGTQTWMAENLNYEYNADSAKSYCYDNDPVNCDTYGRLYNWYAARGECNSMYAEECKGICPEGFRIPSASNWSTLYKYVEFFYGYEGVGTALKATVTWTTDSTLNIPGTDRYGFSALASGFYFRMDGVNADTSLYGFKGIGSNGTFWTSNNGTYYLSYSTSNFLTGSSTKSSAYSVRCIMDQSP